MRDIILKLKKEIKHRFKSDISHGFDHTERVYNTALGLAKNKKVDLDVVEISALLHDIARNKEERNSKICHAKEGAKMAQQILKKYHLSKEKVTNIAHCIETHRYSKKLTPKTIEAQIIQDADRLDAIGAISIARVFAYSGKTKMPFHNASIKPKKVYLGEASETSINHFFEKILKIKPNNFNTKKAKGIAKERYRFTKNFVDRFLKEWNGKI